MARELLKLGARPRTADKVWHEAEMKLAQCMAVYAHGPEMIELFAWCMSCAQKLLLGGAWELL